jgi:hypothetical protein
LQFSLLLWNKWGKKIKWNTSGNVKASAKRSLSVARKIKSSGTSIIAWRSIRLGVIVFSAEPDVVFFTSRYYIPVESSQHSLTQAISTSLATNSESASVFHNAPDAPAVFTQSDNDFSAMSDAFSVVTNEFTLTSS